MEICEELEQERKKLEDKFRELDQKIKGGNPHHFGHYWRNKVQGSEARLNRYRETRENIHLAVAREIIADMQVYLDLFQTNEDFMRRELTEHGVFPAGHLPQEYFRTNEDIYIRYARICKQVMEIR